MSERIRLSDIVHAARLGIANRLRLLFRRRLGHVVLQVQGAYPERVPRRERSFPLSLLPWPPPAPSVESFSTALERLAADPRVEGAVFLISELSAEPATVASLRQAIARLRESGKTTTAYVQDGGMWSYYLATACERVYAPESGGLPMAGLWSEALFLRDTLALAGLEADFEAIGEYKTSPDMLRRSEMDAPHREMLDSLLSSIYGEVVDGVATGRALTAARVRELFDAVPLTAAAARDGGLLDGVCYEDELPALLGSPEARARLLTWHTVEKQLVEARRLNSRQAIGVISLEGTIVPGHSRRPPIPVPLPLPLPEEQAGAETLAAQLRAAARNKHLAAVVLHVDSPGGSAAASDLIWREVVQLRRAKPVVVYMGNRAASGGYYVAAPASAIVAQPLTLTGSIGIWGGKLVTRGLWQKLRANREVVSRGEAAGIYSDAAPFTPEQRARIRASIGDGYARFKARVAEGRHMDDEQVEAVARGRVWTGEQALARGLVDALGDLQHAAGKARELAGVPANRHAELINVPVPKQYQLPPRAPAEASEWLAGGALAPLAALWALTDIVALLGEGLLALAPWQIRIRDRGG